MNPLYLGIISVAVIIILALFRVPIAYALGIAGVGGLIYFYGPSGAFQLAVTILHDKIGDFNFTAVPLFLLMGYFALYAGFTGQAYEVGRVWVGKMPGGLASATVVASALFAACSGSGLPAAAALGRISVPEMVRYGYHPRLATGTVAAATPLAVLIPPSTIMIIYGILTNTSIAQLLIAGIIPGVIAAIVFMIGITIRAWLNPAVAPPYTDPISWRRRFLEVRKVTGIGVLFLLVIGSIYLGWATPTESAGFGAFGAMILALGVRKLTWTNLKLSIADTVKVGGMIFLLTGMAFVYGTFLTRSGVISQLAQWVVSLNLSTYGFILALIPLYIVLGMFLDSVGMMVLTIPVVLPILSAMGINLIWFGILIVIFVEIAAITPPLGITVYVVKGVVGEMISLEDIFKGASFFLMLWAFILALLIALPLLSLWLPSTMMH